MGIKARAAAIVATVVLAGCGGGGGWGDPGPAAALQVIDGIELPDDRASIGALFAELRRRECREVCRENARREGYDPFDPRRDPQVALSMPREGSFVPHVDAFAYLAAETPRGLGGAASLLPDVTGGTVQEYLQDVAAAEAGSYPLHRLGDDVHVVFVAYTIEFTGDLTVRMLLFGHPDSEWVFALSGDAAEDIAGGARLLAAQMA